MVCKVLQAVFVAAFCACVVLPASAGSQESKSAPLAKQLAQVLDAAKLESMAAADPTTGAFVAALYIPGTQLLVVSGKFDAPSNRHRAHQPQGIQGPLHGPAGSGQGRHARVRAGCQR